jgi:MFS superfamily sulfate permease-like transporter
MNLNALRHDIPAGIVVFLVALPLSLGIAQASGMPPFVGLLTGVIGGVVVTLLSPSRFAVSGPAAGLVTIVIGAMETLGSFSSLLLALILAGALQIVFGIIKAGRFARLIPGSVIQGMLAAIGLLLITQQIPVALGYEGNRGLRGIFGDPSFHLSPVVAGVALVSLFILWLWATPAFKKNKFLTYVPGPLVAVLWGSLAVVFGGNLFPESIQGMPRILLPSFDSFGELTAQLEGPNWSAWTNPSVYVVAITLALVASLETLLSQEALKKLKRPRPARIKRCGRRALAICSAVCSAAYRLPQSSCAVRLTSTLGRAVRPPSCCTAFCSC